MDAVVIAAIIIVLIIMGGVAYATRERDQIRSTIGDLTIDIEQESLSSLIDVERR